VGVAGDAFHFAEFFIKRGFALVLNAQINGGVDSEAADLDVFLFQNDFQIAPDRIHGIGLLAFTAPLWPQINGFLLRGLRLTAGDGLGIDHPVEGGIALADGGGERAERVEGIRAADDAREHGAFR